MNEPANFWETKTLKDMTPNEWESLCDGCGKCCLHKLEDEEDGQVYYTNIACRLLDEEQCRCQSYENRLDEVEDCVNLTPQDVKSFHWLPPTCAYRLISEEKPLMPWHHLVSGSVETIHNAGASVKGRVISEMLVAAEDYEDCIVHWVD